MSVRYLSSTKKSLRGCAVGIPVFGPTAQAARLEGSKAFSKAFMDRHRIPTAAYRSFTSHKEAVAYVGSTSHPIVIKADGLAAGKGVLIPTSKEEALAGLESIMVAKEFGDAGSEVVIEEFLEGQELSVLCFCDGYTILPMPAAQDHKRIGDGDTGPNTGGMGTYSPAPVDTPEVQSKIMQQVLKPTIDGMRKNGGLFGHTINSRADLVRNFLHRHAFRWYSFRWLHDLTGW